MRRICLYMALLFGAVYIHAAGAELVDSGVRGSRYAVCFYRITGQPYR